MKTIGLIGGVVWPASLEYYRRLNQGVNARLGGHEAARALLYSFNYGDIVRLDDLRAAGPLVIDAAQTLHRAGAECLALCANVLHAFAETIEATVPLPLIHVADATSTVIRRRGLTTVGLLGTLPTMTEPFYAGRLAAAGITALVPDEPERTYVHDTIMAELVPGHFRPETKTRFIEIMDALAQRSAQGIVLACNEIPLLVKPEDAALPLFDTLAIHADAIVEYALEEELARKP